MATPVELTQDEANFVASMDTALDALLLDGAEDPADAPVLPPLPEYDKLKKFSDKGDVTPGVRQVFEQAAVATVRAINDNPNVISQRTASQDDQATTGGSTTSGTFVAATGYPSWTTTVAAGSYVMDVDLSLYVQASPSIAQFRLMVDGVAVSGQPVNAQTVYLDELLITVRAHFSVLLTLTAGSHTFSLQWVRLSGTGTLTNNASPSPTQHRCFTLR